MSEYNAGTHFDEGFKARYAGKHRADNPYTIRSMQGHEWMTGWTDADNKIYKEARARNISQLNEQGHGIQFLQD